jgi:hypothetical protein
MKIIVYLSVLESLNLQSSTALNLLRYLKNSFVARKISAASKCKTGQFPLRKLLVANRANLD